MDNEQAKARARRAARKVGALLAAAIKVGALDDPRITRAQTAAARAWERAGNKSEAAKWRWAASQTYGKEMR